MAIELMMWAGAINVILLIRLAWRAPEAIRLHAEAERISADVKMIYARIELEKHNREHKQEARQVTAPPDALR